MLQKLKVGQRLDPLLFLLLHRTVFSISGRNPAAFPLNMSGCGIFLMDLCAVKDTLLVITNQMHPTCLALLSVYVSKFSVFYQIYRNVSEYPVKIYSYLSKLAVCWVARWCSGLYCHLTAKGLCALTCWLTRGFCAEIVYSPHAWVGCLQVLQFNPTT